MTALEIVLVLVGFILFIGSFFVSEKITASSEQLKVAIDVNEVKKLIRIQISDMNEEIETAINEAIGNTTEGVQRSMEKLSNEKIMAISEYSDTVMDSINKNHNEVMFLYGMLNDKNKEIKDTAELITKANKGINIKMNEAQLIIDKMDKQIIEMNKFTANHQESVMNDEADIEEGIEYSNLNENEEDDFNNQEVFEDIDESNGEEEKEEIFGNFSNEKVKDYDQDEEEVTNNNSKILEMSKEGQSALEIAKSLGLGVGEVQLVIGLFEGERR